MNLDFLLEMGWKSALVAALALGFAALMRRRSSSDRAILLQTAVALLLAMPIISLTLPALEVETPAPVSESRPAVRLNEPMMKGPEVSAPTLYGHDTLEAADEGLALPDVEYLLIAAYGIGVLVIFLRLMAGLLTLRGWAGRADPVIGSTWAAALLSNADQSKTLPRLLVSDEAPAPMSWGLRHPVILLDRASASRPEDAEAILIHELAHIARRDWLSLLMARAAVALFWFNPLVWLLERNMFQQLEEAADAQALNRVEPTRYAQALVTCAGHRRPGALPANSMASSGLARRVRAALDEARITEGSRWTIAAVIGCVALSTPVAALKLVEASPAQSPTTMSGAVPSAAHAGHAPLALAAQLAPALVVEQPAETDGDVMQTVHHSPEAPAVPAVALASVPSAPPPPPLPPAAHPTRSFAYTLPPVAPRVPSAEEINRHVQASLEGLDAQIAVATAAIEIDAAHIARTAQQRAMSHGAIGMEKGAESMETSAREMERQAARLRSRKAREEIIARDRARGSAVSHEDLIEASHELAESAQDLREGAKELRRAAREMRSPS